MTTVARRLLRSLLPTLVLSLAGPSLLAHTDITPTQARNMILAGGVIVVDVREYSEFCGTVQHIPDALSLPWNSGIFRDRLAELPSSATLLLVCASGSRSHAAATYLDAQGYTSVYDMLSGMSGWSWEKEACGVQPVLRLRTTGSGVEANWTPAYSTTNRAQDYELLTGGRENIADAGTFIDLGPTVCLQNDSAYTYRVLSDLPPLPGSTNFYLARQKGESWGRSSSGQEETPSPPVCE